MEDDVMMRDVRYGAVACRVVVDGCSWIQGVCAAVTNNNNNNSVSPSFFNQGMSSMASGTVPIIQEQWSLDHNPTLFNE
eukprot:scaffold1211_cov195-Alexandrium_tamarense.AAC.22